MNLLGGVHDIGSRGQHKETQSFKIGSGLPEDNNPTSCVLVIDDLSLFKVPLPPPFISKGGRVTRKVPSQLL
jgi:hypothetical protein